MPPKDLASEATQTPHVEAKPAVYNTAGSGYTYTFNVTNNCGKDVDQILLTPDLSGNMSLSRQIFNVTPFHHGDTTTMTVNIGDLKAGSKHCFFVTLMAQKGSCCTVQVCPSLPDCCATVTSEFECSPKGSYTGTLTIVNTSPNPIQSIYLFLRLRLESGLSHDSAARTRNLQHFG